MYDPNILTNYYCVHVTSLYKINRFVPSYFCGTKECPQSLLMGYTVPWIYQSTRPSPRLIPNYSCALPRDQSEFEAGWRLEDSRCSPHP